MTIQWIAVDGKMVRVDQDLIHYLRRALVESGDAWEEAKKDQTKAIEREQLARDRYVAILEQLKTEERRRGLYQPLA